MDTAVNTRGRTPCSWRAYIRLELKLKCQDLYWAFQVALLVKNLPANTGDVRYTGLIPRGKDPRGGHGNPLQYSHLKNPMDRGARRAIVHRIAKIRHDWSDLAHSRYVLINPWKMIKHLRHRDKDMKKSLATTL